MPFVAVDQRFVQYFQHVAFDFAQPEAADVGHDLADQRSTGGVGDYPVEEVAFDRAADAGRGEGLARQHPLGIVLGQVHHRQRDAFGDDHQVRVLEPQRIALDLAAIHQLEQVGPELALERLGRAVLEALPNTAQLAVDATVSDRLVPKLRADRQRVGGQ